MMWWVNGHLGASGVTDFLTFVEGRPRILHGSGGLYGGMAVELLAAVAGGGIKLCDPLSLRCLGCGRYLFGDVGRYRHPAPTCEAFRTATPAGLDHRAKGHSYQQTWYEEAVGTLLGTIGSVDDATISEVVRLHEVYQPKADELGLARIAKEREEAGRKLAQTRDIVAWQATMTRLDAAEALARQPLEAPRLTPLEIVDYLRSLPALWADSGPDGRQVITNAIFARTDVLGFRRLEYELTEDAIELGLDAALPSVLELKSKVGGFGRGERDSASLTHPPAGFTLINRTRRREAAAEHSA
jgi:hypothetical protein